MPGGRPLKADGDIAPQINDRHPEVLGIQNPAYRPAAFFIKKEVMGKNGKNRYREEEEEPGENSRLFQKGEDRRHHENRAERHRNLPERFSGEHFRQGKSERIRQHVKDDKHRALQSDGESGEQNERIDCAFHFLITTYDRQV